MWILTLPSFTWIQVDQEGQNVPPPRAGHTCHVYNGQFLVIGGYVGQKLSCDSPGIYVFDVAELEWKTGYVPPKKEEIADSPEFEYLAVAQVPRAVQKVVGGNANGGATATVPVATADPDSPLASGPVFTITRTAENGEKTTEVTTENPLVSSTLPYPSKIPDSEVDDNSELSDGNGAPRTRKTGAIVGGVLGGVVFLLALALLGAWILYKRKLKQFRQERLGSVSDGGSLMGGNEEMRMAGSTGDLLGEPSFWGVMVARRRSLRVVNN